MPHQHAGTNMHQHRGELRGRASRSWEDVMSDVLLRLKGSCGVGTPGPLRTECPTAHWAGATMEACIILPSLLPARPACRASTAATGAGQRRSEHTEVEPLNFTADAGGVAVSRDLAGSSWAVGAVRNACQAGDVAFDVGVAGRVGGEGATCALHTCQSRCIASLADSEGKGCGVECQWGCSVVLSRGCAARVASCIHGSAYRACMRPWASCWVSGCAK